MIHCIQEVCGDVVQLLLIQFGVHRQGDHAVAQRLGYGEVAFVITQVGEGFLQMQGHGIVYHHGNTQLFHVLNQTVAVHILQLQSVLMENVGAIAGCGRGDYIGMVGEGLVVIQGSLLTGSDIFVQVFQFHIQNGGLDGVEA